MSLPLALKSTSFHVRLLRTRLPFRYGAVTLTHFPLLHLAVEVETADGRRGRRLRRRQPAAQVVRQGPAEILS